MAYSEDSSAMTRPAAARTALPRSNWMPESAPAAPESLQDRWIIQEKQLHTLHDLLDRIEPRDAAQPDGPEDGSLAVSQRCLDLLQWLNERMVRVTERVGRL